MTTGRFWVLFFLLFTLLFAGACKKGRKGHFTAKPQRQMKGSVDKGNLNDCEEMEKQRDKKNRQSIKRKKQITKKAEEKEKADRKPEKRKEKVPVQDYKKGSVKTGSSGLFLYLKIGGIVLLGLAAIGFVIGLAIFTLASIALSIVLVPLLITFAWFIVAGIAYLGISLVNQIRRRRMRRRKRRRQKDQGENEESPEEINEEKERESEEPRNGEDESEK